MGTRKILAKADLVTIILVVLLAGLIIFFLIFIYLDYCSKKQQNDFHDVPTSGQVLTDQQKGGKDASHLA